MRSASGRDRPASRGGWRRRPGCARRRAASTGRRSRRPVRSMLRDWPSAIQSSGTRSARSGQVIEQVARQTQWSSSVVLRKSGVWQASHSREQRGAVRGARRATSLIDGELAQDALVERFLRRASAPRAAAARPGSAAARRASRSRGGCCATGPRSTGSKRCASTALDEIVDPSARSRPVTPKVPSRQEAAGAAGDLADLVGMERPACACRRTWPGRRRPHGRRPCSGPCRWRRWRPGSPPRRTGRAPPGRCACAARASPSPPPRRRAGGGSVRRWRRPPRPRRRPRRCGAAGG